MRESATAEQLALVGGPKILGKEASVWGRQNDPMKGKQFSGSRRLPSLSGTTKG